MCLRPAFTAEGKGQSVCQSSNAGGTFVQRVHTLALNARDGSAFYHNIGGEEIAELVEEEHREGQNYKIT